jgi:hypothetical protein
VFVCRHSVGRVGIGGPTSIAGLDATTGDCESRQKGVGRVGVRWIEVERINVGRTDIDGTGVGLGTGLQRMKGNINEESWGALELGLGTGKMALVEGAVGQVDVVMYEKADIQDRRNAGVETASTWGSIVSSSSRRPTL